MLGTSSVRAAQAHRLAGNQIKTVVELRKIIKRAQDGPGDQMRVRRFAAVVFFQMLVDDPAIFVKEFYRDAPLRSRGGNSEAGLHVLDNLARAAANGNRFAASLFGHGCRNWFGRGSSRFRGRRRRRFRSCSRAGSASAVIGVFGLRSYGGYGGFAQQFSEICAPGLVNQLGVAAKTTQQPFNVGGIRAKVFGNKFREIGSSVLLTQT
jgi:hypothetical protein